MAAVKNKRSNDAAALIKNACVVVYVRFPDGNQRPFYSRDVDCRYKNKSRYHNESYWMNHLMKVVNTANFGKWSNVPLEAGFFQWDGHRKGLKLAQFYNHSGFDDNEEYYTYV